MSVLAPGYGAICDEAYTFHYYVGYCADTPSILGMHNKVKYAWVFLGVYKVHGLQSMLPAANLISTDCSV